MSEPTDIDALIEASRTWVPAECAASPVGAWHIIERLADALEQVRASADEWWKSYDEAAKVLEILATHDQKEES